MSGVFRFPTGLEVNDLRMVLPRRDILIPKRTLSRIRGIMIHHTGSPTHRDFTAKEIADYHVYTRNWPITAYDWLVHWNGIIDYCKSWEIIGNHVDSPHNAEWLSICFAGWWSDGREPPRDMLDRGLDLIDSIGYSLGRAFDIAPHSKFSATHCPGVVYDRLKSAREPGVDWESQSRQLQQRIDRAVEVLRGA